MLFVLLLLVRLPLLFDRLSVSLSLSFAVVDVDFFVPDETLRFDLLDADDLPDDFVLEFVDGFGFGCIELPDDDDVMFGFVLFEDAFFVVVVVDGCVTFVFDFALVIVVKSKSRGCDFCLSGSLLIAKSVCDFLEENGLS